MEDVYDYYLTDIRENYPIIKLEEKLADLLFEIYEPKIDEVS